MSAKETLDIAKAVVAYLARKGVAIDDVTSDDLINIERVLGENKLTLRDELRLDQIIVQLSAMVKPLTIEGVLSEPSYFGNMISFLGSRKTWVATTVNGIGIVLTLLIISLTTEYTIISASVDSIRKIQVSNYFNTLDDTIPLLVKRLHSEQLNADELTTWNKNLQFIRDTDSALSQSTIRFYTILDRASGSPNWCTLVLRLYGQDRWCKAREIADLPDTSPGLQLDSEIANLNAQRGRLGSYLGIGFASPFQGQTIGLEINGGGDLALVLGNSILPLLYGLLGSVVFIMRQLFGNGEDLFGGVLGGMGDGKLLFGRVILRICLGGVAGLAIGWFWTPESAKEFTQPTTFSTAPFAIAFLAGFSIEVLFSILDRVIAAINPKQVSPKNA
jgi:hypothetical protein